MSVLVDTNVWSLALRRNTVQSSPVVHQLESLIDSDLAVLFGPVRQELLSGFRNKEQYEKLKKELRNFPDLSINTEDYELAAELHSACIRNGIQASPIDILICAVAITNKLEIFTLDNDFIHYQRVVPISLFRYTSV